MNVLREKTSGELFASDYLNLDKPLRAVSSPRVQDLFAPESYGNRFHGLADYDTPSSRARGGQKWQLTLDLPDVDGAPHNKCSLLTDAALGAPSMCRRWLRCARQ